ncbi:MAG: hypothetical protein ACERKZ_22090 [Lachnotalea sp.]
MEYLSSEHEARLYKLLCEDNTNLHDKERMIYIKKNMVFMM